MTCQFNVVVESERWGFRGHGAELAGCHTQSRLLDPLMDRVPEAIELTIELEGEPAVGLILARLQPG